MMSTASKSSSKQFCSAFTSATSALEVNLNVMRSINSRFTYLSLWLIGTVRAESETVISRAWVQSPDPAE